MSEVKFVKGNSFNLLDSFKVNLSCNQCHAFSPDSAILPCSHIMCKKCITKPQGLFRSQRSTFSCFVCGPKTTFSTLGLEKNFLAEQVASTEQVKEYFTKQGKCSDCLVKPAEIATYYCASCAKYMCEHDSEAHRKFTSGAKYHAVVNKYNMTCLVSNSVPMESHPTHFGPCPRHPTALLEFFCEKDQALGCAICITAEHHGHDLLKPGQALCSSVQELDKTYQNLEEEISQFLEEKTRLSQVRNSLPQEEITVEENITKYYDDLITKLRSKKESEIETMRKTFSKTRDDISKSLESISSIVNHLSQTKTILEMTRNYTPPSTILEKSHFLKKMCHKTISENHEFMTQLPNKPDIRIVPDFGLEADINKMSVSREILKLRSAGKLGLQKPVSVVTDENQQIYVIDSEEPKVHIFSEGGKFIRQFKIDSGWSLGNVQVSPWGVAVRNEMLYITDLANKCVIVYDMNGIFIAVVGMPSDEDPSSELLYPEGLYVTEDDWLYVADRAEQLGGAVKVYDGSEKANFALRQVIEGDGDHKLNQPCDVNVVNREIVVLDEGNPCLHVFSLRGDYLRSFINRVPQGKMEFPLFFAYCPLDDSFLFTDTELRQVFKYDRRGNLVFEYFQFQFERPGGVAVTSSGRLILTDTRANLVYVI